MFCFSCLIEVIHRLQYYIMYADLRKYFIKNCYCCYVQIEFMIMSMGIFYGIILKPYVFCFYCQVLIRLVFKTVSDIFNRPVYRTSPALEWPNCPRPVNRNYPRQYSVLFSASRYTSTLGTVNKPSSTI